MTDDDIAALDGEWTGFPPSERAALEFTRKLSLHPHTVTSTDVEEMKKHYPPKQVLEIVVTVASYNSTNRWTDGLNIPAEEEGGNFRKPDSKLDLSKFTTPTSSAVARRITKVAPIAADTKSICPPVWPTRPRLEDRVAIESAWSKAKSRAPQLPLADEVAARELWKEGPVPNWVKLLAIFPRSSSRRVSGQQAAEEKGILSPRLKAAIAWTAAREDRAWYALAIARDRLKATGLSDDQIFLLDADGTGLTDAERQAVAFVRKLTSAPALVTDADVELLRKVYSDKEVAELVHHVCNAAFFNRVTEAAKLPLDR